MRKEMVLVWVLWQTSKKYEPLRQHEYKKHTPVFELNMFYTLERSNQMSYASNFMTKSWIIVEREDKSITISYLLNDRRTET